MSKTHLIIHDDQAVWVNGHERRTATPADPLPRSLLVLINLSELEVKQTPLPKLSWLDRQRYSRSRRGQIASHQLYASQIVDQSLVEINCPVTTYLLEWLKHLSSRTKVTLSPLLEGPKTQGWTLVITHTESGLRQTAYNKQIPVFTRFTTGLDATSETQDTLHYLRHQWGAENIAIESHNLPESLNANPTNSGEWLNKDFSFTLPLELRAEAQQKRHMLGNQLLTGTIALASLGISWQLNDYLSLTDESQSQQQQIEKLSEQLNSNRSQLPLDQRLPDPYKTRLKDPSPLSTFMGISIAMNHDIILSALKWERVDEHERLLLEVKVRHQEDEADQKLDAMKDFCSNLADALPGFEIKTEALPHATSDQETFAGTASSTDVSLGGDQTSGRIQLIRKINS